MGLKLWEALKIHDETGRRMRPKGRIDLEYLNAADLLRRDMEMEFEVEPAKVEVTKESLKKAIEKYRMSSEEAIDLIAEELGL